MAKQKSDTKVEKTLVIPVEEVTQNPSIADTLDIVGIGVLSLSIDNNKDTPRYAHEVEGYELDVSCTPYTRPEYLLKIVVEMSVVILFEEGESSNAEFSIEVVFKLNIPRASSKKTKFVSSMLNRETADAAVSIAYSTARGVLFSRASGTLLDGIITPIVQPKDLVVYASSEEKIRPSKKINAKK